MLLHIVLQGLPTHLQRARARLPEFVKNVQCLQTAANNPALRNALAVAEASSELKRTCEFLTQLAATRQRELRTRQALNERAELLEAERKRAIISGQGLLQRSLVLRAQLQQAISDWFPEQQVKIISPRFSSLN